MENFTPSAVALFKFTTEVRITKEAKVFLNCILNDVARRVSQKGNEVAFFYDKKTIKGNMFIPSLALVVGGIFPVDKIHKGGFNFPKAKLRRLVQRYTRLKVSLIFLEMLSSLLSFVVVGIARECQVNMVTPKDIRNALSSEELRYLF